MQSNDLQQPSHATPHGFITHVMSTEKRRCFRRKMRKNFRRFQSVSRCDDCTSTRSSACRQTKGASPDKQGIMRAARRSSVRTLRVEAPARFTSTAREDVRNARERTQKRGFSLTATHTCDVINRREIKRRREQRVGPLRLSSSILRSNAFGEGQLAPKFGRLPCKNMRR